jgi:hypothetical protein
MGLRNWKREVERLAQANPAGEAGNKSGSPALSGSFSYTPLLDAGCADSHALYFSINHSANTLKVRIPSAVGDVVRMTDVMSINRFLAADFTYFCHLMLRNFTQFNGRMPILQLYERPGNDAFCFLMNPNGEAVI